MRILGLSILCLAWGALQVPMAWCDDLGLHAEIAADAHEHDCCGHSALAKENAEGYSSAPADNAPHVIHVTVDLPFMPPTAQIDDAPVHVTIALDPTEAVLTIGRAASASDVPVEPTSARARTTVQLL